MSKSVKSNSDPFLLGLDEPGKKGEKPKLEKPATENKGADPFMLGVEVKKKEPTSQESSTTPDQGTTDLQNGTKPISPSPLPSNSEDTETDLPVISAEDKQKTIDYIKQKQGNPFPSIRQQPTTIAESVFNPQASKSKERFEMRQMADAEDIKAALEKPTAENIKKVATKAIKKNVAGIATGLELNEQIISGKKVELPEGFSFDEQKEVERQTAEFNKKFLNGEIDGGDIAVLKQGNPLINKSGQQNTTDDQVAAGINQKTQNLRDFANASNQDGNTYYFTNKKLQQDKGRTEFLIKNAESTEDEKIWVNKIDTQLPNQAGSSSNGLIYVNREDFLKEQSQKLTDTKDKEYFLNTNFKANRYEPRATKVASDLIATIGKVGEIDTGAFGTGISADEDIYIQKTVNDYLRKLNDPVINGGNGVTELPMDQRFYNDIYNRVRDYYNDVVPVKNWQQTFLQPFTNSPENKKFKPLVDNIKSLDEYFNNEGTQQFESVLKSTTDANQVAIYDKYDKILQSNPIFNKIQNKYGQLVKNGTIDEATATKNMELELKATPEFKGLFNERNKEITSTLKLANEQRQKRLIDGVKSVPGLKVYEDGTLGIEGATQEETKKFIQNYQKKSDEALAAAVQSVKSDKESTSEDIVGGYKKKYGGFVLGGGAGLSRGYGSMMESATRWMAANLGIGQDMSYYYTARNKELGEIVDNSEFAKKHFEYKGLASLVDPSYYAYNVGQSASYMAPGLVVGLGTGGGATGAIIGGVTGAGLETVQNGLNTYNDLITQGKDEYGLPITPYKAQKAMTDNMAGEILPNILLQSLEFGTLLRGAKAVKPSLNIGKGAVDLAKTGALEGLQEGLQGQVQYNAAREAKGENKLDLWDYMQTDDFRQNFYGGLAGGIGFGAGAKAAQVAGHAKNVSSWEKMVKAGNNELTQNALYGYAQQAEKNGTGSEYRDGLRLRLSNEQYKDATEKKELEQHLAYSAKLSNAVTQLNVAPGNVVGMAAAHNLSLAELNENLAKANEGNPLAKIYSNKAKEYQQEAEKLVNGKTNDLYYATTPDGTNVFLSKQNADVLQQEGILDNLKDRGAIVGVSENIKLKENQPEETKKGEKPAIIPTPENANDQLFDRVFAKKGEINNVLDENGKEESVSMLKDQALSTPNSLNEKLGNDEELTTDLIASNGVEKINVQIQTFINQQKSPDTTDQQTEEIDKHLSLLDKGLEKANILQTQNNQNGNQKSGEESSQKSSKEGGQESSSEESGGQGNVLTQTNQGAAETAGTEAAPIQKSGTDSEIENRMKEIQDSNPSLDSNERKEFNVLEKEMEKREKNSVFSVPLEKVSKVVDDLMSKEKEKPNGFGSFIERKDARETKEVAERYSHPINIKDSEIKNDFKEAVMGNPDTWYADGLKLRESLKEASNRGIDTREMIEQIENEFIKDGYTSEDAKAIVSRRLAPIFKGSQKVNELGIAPSATEKPKVRVTAEQVEKAQPQKEEPTAKKKELSNKLRELLGNSPVALNREGDTNPQNRVSFSDLGISPTDTIDQFIDKLINYGGEYTELLKPIKEDANISKLKLELSESRRGGQNNEAGLYHPFGHGEGKDGLLQIHNKDNVYYTAVHELMHFFTLDSAAAEQVKDSQSYKGLEEFYNYIADKKGKPVAVAGNATVESYGLTNVKEFMAELLINPKFREYASDVFAENKDDILKTNKAIRDSKVNSIGDLILNFFKDLFAKVFVSNKSDISIDQSKPVIENAAKLATDLFFGGKDVTAGQTESGEGGEVVGMGSQNQKAAALAFPSGAINEDISKDIGGKREGPIIQQKEAQKILDSLSKKYGIEGVFADLGILGSGGEFNGRTMKIEINRLSTLDKQGNLTADIEGTGNYSRRTIFHEYIHPFVRLLNGSNKELYNNILKEAKEVNEKTPFTDISHYPDSQQDEEIIVRYLDRLSDNDKTPTLLSRFFEWLSGFFFKNKKNGRAELAKLSKDTTVGDLYNVFKDYGNLKEDLINQKKEKSPTDKLKEEIASYEKMLEGTLLNDKEKEFLKTDILARLKNDLNILEGGASKDIDKSKNIISDFIKESLKSGENETDIRAALIDNGISEEAADKYITEVKSKEEKKKSEKKIVEEKINEIGSNADDALLDSVEHRRQVASDVSVEDTAKMDKLRLELVQQDANAFIQDMKDQHGKKYITKALDAISSINKNNVDLDKILAVGIALENEINNIKDGFTENEFGISRTELNKVYAKIQKINVGNSRISSKAMNTIKTLYNNYDNTIAKENILTKEQSAEKEAIMDAILNEEKLSEAAEAHEKGVQLTEEAKAEVAKKDTRKPKVVTERTKMKGKIQDILTDLNDQLNKLDC